MKNFIYSPIPVSFLHQVLPTMISAILYSILNQVNFLWNRAGRSKSMLVTQSCSTFCDPMDCSPPDSSVHRILQTKILEWVAISFFKFCHQRIRLFYKFFNHNITIVLQYNHRKGILGVVSFTLC